jgi:uncharacterized damage-inducible protein DinB
MSKEALIAELKHESALTRKMLERVPVDKASWKPHEKSMSLGRLATHVAEIPHWISDIINADEYDFGAHPFTRHIAASPEELVEICDTRTNNAIADLAAIDENALDNTWTVKNGDQVYFAMPKKVAIRGWGLSHLYHHRGQLSVYLRLLDIPVPGMYGPSADERM